MVLNYLLAVLFTQLEGGGGHAEHEEFHDVGWDVRSLWQCIVFLQSLPHYGKGLFCWYVGEQSHHIEADHLCAGCRLHVFYQEHEVGGVLHM